jgi:acyl-lipid omega-6 desaturase (Delta-12 desaturase)
MGQLGKADYARLQAQLQFRPSPIATPAVVLLDFGLLWAIVLLLRDPSLFGYVISQCLLAVVMFHSFSLLHECGHGSASRSRAFNTVLGHYASLFCFIPYYPWKYIHQQHHVWAGNLEKDPVLKSLRRFRDQGTPVLARASWRSWIPAGALLQHIVYLSYPLQMLRDREARGRLLRCLASVAWMLVGYVLLFWLAPELMRARNWAVAVVVFLIAEELVNLPHHVDMPTFEVKLPLWEQYRATRSCYYPGGISEMFVLNFNFHTEHHLFPSLPWYRLRQARRLLKPALEQTYTEAVGIAWNVRNRRRDLDAIVARYRVTPGMLVAPVEVSVQHDVQVASDRRRTEPGRAE